MSVVPVLVFDGDCAFCTSCVVWARRRVRNLPRAVPFQQLAPSGELQWLGLNEELCASAVQFVDQSGRVFSAEAAIAATLVNAGGVWRLSGLLLRLPVMRHLAGAVYRWVARNRFRLPGGTPACALPPSDV